MNRTFSKLKTIIFRTWFLVILLVTFAAAGKLYSQQAKTDQVVLIKKQADDYFNKARKFLPSLKIDSIKYYNDKLLRISDSSNYELGKGKHFYMKAVVHTVKSQFPEAWENYEKAMSLFQKENDSLYMGICYGGMGKLKNLVNEKENARKYWRTSLCMLEAINDSTEIFGIYMHLSIDNIVGFNIDSAVTYLTRATRIAERLKDHEKLVLAFTNMCYLYMTLSDYETAFYYAEKSIILKPPVVSKVNYRNRLGNIIKCCLGTNRIELARKYIQQYEEINSSLGDVWGEFRLMYNKGIAELYAGNPATAKPFLLNAYRISDSVTTDPQGKADAFFELGKCYQLLGYPDSAENILLKANEIAVTINNKLIRMNCHDVLAEIYFNKGQHDISINHLRKFHDLKDSALNMNKQTVIQSLKMQYETEKKEQQITLLQTEQQNIQVLMQLRLQEIERQKQQLIITSKERELQRLAYMNTQVLLDAESHKRKANEKALTIAEQEKSLQQAALDLKEKELQTKKLEHNLYLMAAFMIVSAGGYSFYRFRKRKLLENQQALLKERLRLSRDLHDDIGSTLSSINVYSEVAAGKLKKQQTAEAEEVLLKMGAASRIMAERMSDIVWSINPENDRLQNITDRMKTFASMMFNKDGIAYTFDIKGALEEAFLTIDQRKNLFLIFKEAVNNILKYARCKNVRIAVSFHLGNLTMTIKDDGHGFDPDNYSTETMGGNGLKNMKARAEELNGSLQISSGINKGTMVKLLLKI